MLGVPTLKPEAPDYATAAEEFMSFVRDEVGPLLDGREQAGVRRLLAVARKAKDQALVRTIPELVDTTTRALKEPGKVPLPGELQKAAKRYLKRDFTTFGQLLDFFTARDTAGTDLPLALEAEFERTLMEIRRAELKFLEERLRLLNARLIVEQERRVWAMQLAHQAGIQPSTKAVKDSLEEWLKGGKDDDFHTGLRDLVRYVQLQGSLNGWSRMIANDLAVLDHRERVRLDEIATAAHARLASFGLQGVTSFAEGGITEAQVANWLRALQTVGLAVIGGRVD
ncbi:MAG: hypothetical protein HY725_22370 [Candidatus Rokubacteria bacterium]|nr:hypothetical protein [Candidatus Rokubacteria bacterium]